MPDKTTVANTFEDAALLKIEGLEFDRAEPRGRRVAVLFRDPDGRGEELLRSHRGDGVSVNSRLFEDGLNWAKRIVFSAKDAEPVGVNGGR